MGTYDEREERMSWREIDKLKDRSKHVSRDAQEFRKKPSSHQEWAKKQYLKKINKLFVGDKEESAEQKSAREEIGHSYGTVKFDAVVNRYIKQYGFPREWGTLILMMDHASPEVVITALKILKEKIGECSLAEQQGIKSKVKILAMTAEDDELRALAEEMAVELA